MCCKMQHSDEIFQNAMTFQVRVFHDMEFQHGEVWGVENAAWNRYA